MVSSGQSLLARGKHEEGLAALREAERLDERNPATRAALLSAVLKRARELMLIDWRAAEPLVRESMDLDAGDPVARSLSTLIEDYKKQEEVARFVVEARTLQGSGDVSGALRKVEAGLSTYPNEIRLSQLYNTLRSASLETRRKETPPAAPARLAPPPTASKPEPQQLARESPAAAPPAAANPFDLPAAVHTTFQPIPSAAAALPAEKPSISDSFAAVISPPPLLQPAVALPADTYTQPPGPGSAGKEPNRLFLLGGSAAAAIVLVSAALLLRSGHPKAIVPPVSGTVPVQFTANVGGAHFTVDSTAVPDAQGVTLKPGVHKAEATLEGYTTDFKDFTVPKGRPETVVLAFHLQPLLPELRVNSDLKAGRYILDGVPPADLQEGSLVRDSVAAGRHTLTILDGTRPVFAFGFAVRAKEAAILAEPLSGN